MAEFLQQNPWATLPRAKPIGRDELLQDDGPPSLSDDLRDLRKSFQTFQFEGENVEQLPDDVHFLSRHIAVPPNEIQRLQAIQHRMNRAPSAYLSALLETIPRLPKEHRSAKREMLNLAIDLSRRTGRQEELIQVLARERENSQDDQDRQTITTVLDTLARDPP